jgi:hypothetical protein
VNTAALKSLFTQLLLDILTDGGIILLAGLGAIARVSENAKRGDCAHSFFALTGKVAHVKSAHFHA